MRKHSILFPLLSGHMGGAIPLAEQIADITGAIPVDHDSY